MKHIVMIGTGVVGLASAKGLIAWGFNVTCCDTNPIRLKELKEMGFSVCTPDCLPDYADAYFMTLPTPTENKAINLSYLISATENLGKKLQNSTHSCPLVIFRSTTPPGTVEFLLLPKLENLARRKVGQNLAVVMNPEYLTAVDAEYDFLHPHVQIFGVLQGDVCSEALIRSVYANVSCPTFVVEPRVAEAAKYLHNIMGAFRISFFNQFREVLNTVHVDTALAFRLVTESELSRKNPNYGTKDLGPFGGMCLPKDTQSFLTWAESMGIELPLLSAVIEFNHELENRPKQVGVNDASRNTTTVSG